MRSRLALHALLGFAVFGSFWGTWGAAIPVVRTQTGVSHSELGAALLFVGAGALPAMLLTGRAVDRWGLRVATVTIALLGASGVVLAGTAQDLTSLSVALTAVGVTSGASDVAINSLAGRAQRESGRPVVFRAHAVFSAFVVVASLATGLFNLCEVPLIAPFGLVAAGAVATAVLMARDMPGRASAGERSGPDPNHTPPPTASPWFDGEAQACVPGVPTGSILALGLLGALAFASENAHQSWSAVFLTDAIGTGTGLSAVAPALFAGTVATARFATAHLDVSRPQRLLAAGSGTAAAGAAVISIAPNLALCLLGLVTAAAGCAVLFPTILGVLSARVEENRRGRATSMLTAISYLGFLLGPVYVGFWAGEADVRGAMSAVAALGVLLLVLTPLARPHPRSPR